MHVWKIAILPDPNGPCEKSGYCIAESKADALAMIDDPNGVVYDTPRRKVLPGKEGENFGSFQITDFPRNGWASRMTLSPAIKFWMGRRSPLPRMSDVSKKFGVEDFEALKAATDRIGQELEKA